MNRKLVVISVVCAALPEHTPEQFDEWVRYKVGEKPQIASSNQLADEDLSANVKEISK